MDLLGVKGPAGAVTLDAIGKADALVPVKTTSSGKRAVTDMGFVTWRDVAAASADGGMDIVKKGLGR